MKLKVVATRGAAILNPDVIEPLFEVNARENLAETTHSTASTAAIARPLLRS